MSAPLQRWRPLRTCERAWAPPPPISHGVLQSLPRDTCRAKEVILLGHASAPDVAFYFVHWLTDLAGAEPFPQEGFETSVANETRNGQVAHRTQFWPTSDSLVDRIAPSPCLSIFIRLPALLRPPPTFPSPSSLRPTLPSPIFLIARSLLLAPQLSCLLAPCSPVLPPWSVAPSPSHPFPQLLLLLLQVLPPPLPSSHPSCSSSLYGFTPYSAKCSSASASSCCFTPPPFSASSFARRQG